MTHPFISATVILDAKVNQRYGVKPCRITTLEVIMPKFLVAQLNTHRTFCLAGDTQLEFNLPAGNNKNRTLRIHRMSLAEFVDKWHNGDMSTSRKGKQQKDLTGIEPTKVYTPTEAAKLLDYKTASNILTACRKGKLQASKASDDKSWLITGKALITWHTTPVSENPRRDMRNRLENMRIRQINETTGAVVESTVTDAMYSGVKSVYTLTAGDYSVTGSLDHLIKTPEGYTRIGDLVIGSEITVITRVAPEQCKKDAKRLKVIDGKHRSVWQRQQREKLIEENPVCRECNIHKGTDIHHVKPVLTHPELTFDEGNITLLCETCHKEAHKVQGWQEGAKLYSNNVKVTSIEYRGEEETYDLSIAGEFPNFSANGIIVHNSRNSASSRAIPIFKSIQNVLEAPVTPLDYGTPANGKGMQPKSNLTGLRRLLAGAVWKTSMYLAIASAYLLSHIGLHKQFTNRLLEPYTYTKVLITSTEWENFLTLRDHGAAQDAMQEVAKAIRAALDSSVTYVVNEGYWYLPYVGIFPHKPTTEQFDISVSCCAQVSFRTLDDNDAKAKRVVASLLNDDVKHWSPFEHIAVAKQGRYANYFGFRSLRHIKESVC